MIYTVRFSPFAKEYKKEIKTYLSKFYPETPRRFTDSLKEHIANLKINPYIYPEYSENTEYRRMFVGNYIRVVRKLQFLNNFRLKTAKMRSILQDGSTKLTMRPTNRVVEQVYCLL